MDRQKREIASDIGLLWSRPLGFSMVWSTRASALRGADAESSLRRMRVPARASTKARAWPLFVRKRPKQCTAGDACSVEWLVLLVASRVGRAGRLRRLSACCLVHSFPRSRLPVRCVIDHLLPVQADRCLTAAFPELHLSLLSIRV